MRRAPALGAMRHVVGVFLLAVVDFANAQARAWLDVCVAEDYLKYRDELCPTTFAVSTLAFNPFYPRAITNMTILLQPSADLPGTIQKEQFIDIDLPGFEPIGEVNPTNALIRDLTVTAANTVAVGIDPKGSYNTVANPLFASPAGWDTRTRILRLHVNVGMVLLANMDTEIVICCVRLPSASVQDNPDYFIEGPTSLEGMTSVYKEPFKSTPFLDPGLQWEFLRVSFDPPVSMHVTVISLSIRPANNLRDRARIILHMPNIVRTSGVSGVVGFNTANSKDGADWMYFASQALWDNVAEKLTFFLRAGKVLLSGTEVTLSTSPGEFRLPIELEADSPTLTVEGRTFDNVDQVVRPTSVYQSSAVPHVRQFVFSKLMYLHNEPYGFSNVILQFKTNRPLFVGSTVYLRLSGFRSESITVPIKGDMKVHFENEAAVFLLPENIIELRVVKTIYSDEFVVSVEMLDLILPPALYANDTSILIYNSDPGAPKQSVQESPMVGAGYKAFKRSQMQFDPPEPRMPANISFTLEPSIVFYQGDSITVHMYGFACQEAVIPLLGPDAFRIKGQAAEWNRKENMLVFTVAENEIILNSQPFKVGIGKDTNFRLPDKLSENDGILRIEGQGAQISREPMKKVPKIGEDKYVIESRVEFEPFDTSDNPIARISFSMVLNTDVLPNSSIYIKLGGIVRDPPGTPLGVWGELRSGTIKLSGANGPLFVGEVGYWDQDLVLLTAKMISTVQIFAGERVRFFLERDQYFRLPVSAYPNDPSFRLAIPEAGIPERPFKFSTRVSQEGKFFAISEIFYGAKGSVAYPNTVVEFNFRFRPNVNLPGGTTVRLTLPGFTCPYENVPIGTQAVPVLNEKDLSEFIQFGKWNAMTGTLDLVVPRGKAIYRQLITVMRIMEFGGFRLPSTALTPNDQRLTIQAIGSNIIFEESIKTSPRVVDRSFMVSEFLYAPPQKDSIFQLKMQLQPTVDITDLNDIILYMPGFRNSLSKLNIHIMGEDRYRIANSMGLWNETTAELRMKIPRKQVIAAFTMLDLRIEESQGFILPAALNANDTSLRIASIGNIQEEVIKKSPMVGNGPFSGHMFCMFQYEAGTRTNNPICATALDCYPPLTDPCSPTELLRCGCDSRVDEVFQLHIKGFNLQKEDSVHMLPMHQLCKQNLIGPDILSPFDTATSQEVSEDRDRVTYTGISSMKTGTFRMCVNHVGRLYDVGSISVRPSCRVPLVLVDGSCVEHCPRTKKPVSGHCLRDVAALSRSDTQAYMVPIRMTDPYEGGGPPIATRTSDDPEQRYFIYRYTYELAKILNADPTRISVASLNNGSVIVNTVFKIVGTRDDIMATNERSPYGMISLLDALQQDTSSQLYQSNFFKFIDRNKLLTPYPVRECPEDKVFRVFCPYTGGIMGTAESTGWFVLGITLVPVVFSILCCGIWNIDMDKVNEIDEDLYEKIRKDPSQVDPKMQIEYAHSWLEGRFMGEDWERQRKAIASHI